MKKPLVIVSFFLAAALGGCVVDVVEQITEQLAYGSGKDVRYTGFDATIYRKAFSVQGSPADTLIADGTFSLWAHSNSQAAAIAQNISMNWTLDTLHNAWLTVNSPSAERELVSIDRMSVTIPQKSNLGVTTFSSDVSIQNMTGDINVNGMSSNLNFQTAGRITLQTSDGKIMGSTGLGGSALSTSGDINIILPSISFESIFVRDSSGNVNLKIPAGLPITFHLYTAHGNIDLFYDNVHLSSVTAIETPFNGGGKNVTVQTGTGKITITN